MASKLVEVAMCPNINDKQKTKNFGVEQLNLSRNLNFQLKIF